jgi:hypothetical protein
MTPLMPTAQVRRSARTRVVAAGAIQLAGLGVVSYLGSFAGSANALPFGWDS